MPDANTFANPIKTLRRQSYAMRSARAIEGAVQRLRPKLMTVTAVILSLAPILWESGIGSDVMKPIAAPIVGGMITSTIHVPILVPVFFFLMKRRALRAGTLGIKTKTE
jgi:Cu(I)/Ag(I) efflux system membrane protein CusA/SilA